MPTRILIDRGLRTPVYRQISDALRDQIRAGEIPDGERLPSERALAIELGVNRTTIVNAYDELSASGLVSGEVGRGTVVQAQPAFDAGQSDEGMAWSGLFAEQAGWESTMAMQELMESVTRDDAISVAVACASGDLFPVEAVRTLLNETLDAEGADAFRFAATQGIGRLREAIADLAGRRGVVVDPEQVMVTTGAQQAISMVASCLVGPGDLVAIETPCYTGAISVLRERGARLIGIPTDADGMRVDVLEQVLERNAVKMVFTMPNFSNPSGTVLSADRRRRLLEVTHRFRVPLVNDDVHGSVVLEGPPPPPLAAAGPSDHVITIDSLPKVFISGLRIGWITAAPELIRRAVLVKQSADMSSATLEQELAARVLETGLLRTHLDHVLPRYRERRDLMIDALQRHCGEVLIPNRPGGGMSLWCRLTGGFSARALLGEAVREGVVFLPGDSFSVGSDESSKLRICFGLGTEADLEEGAERLGRAIAAVSQRSVVRRRAAPVV